MTKTNNDKAPKNGVGNLKKKIREEIKLFYKAGSKQALHAIRTGNLLLTLKEKVGHGNFHKKADKYFPELNKRTRQRFMEISPHVLIEDYPALSHLSQKQLQQLCKLASNEDVGTHLTNQGVLVDFDQADPMLIKEFKDSVKHYLSPPLPSPTQPKPKPKPKPKQPALNNNTSYFIKYLCNKYIRNKPNPSKVDSRHLKLIHVLTKGIIETVSDD